MTTKPTQSTAADIHDDLKKNLWTPPVTVGVIMPQPASSMDPKGGVILKQAGIAAATSGKAEAKVERARRIARELAANGPITIDDVTERLIALGVEPADPPKGAKASKWKGGVFRTGDWVIVGEEASRLARCHARMNKLWALKTWVAKNSYNGRSLSISKFDVDGIRREFERKHPKIPKAHCTWFIGTSKLDSGIMTDIRAANHEYQGVPVAFVPNCVGALIQHVAPVVPAPPPTALVNYGPTQPNGNTFPVTTPTTFDGG